MNTSNCGWMCYLSFFLLAMNPASPGLETGQTPMSLVDLGHVKEPNRRLLAHSKFNLRLNL